MKAKRSLQRGVGGGGRLRQVTCAGLSPLLTVCVNIQKGL